ncbi:MULTISPECIES: DUF4097 family beta strand repeat-containing protein [unclassified Streptomyces]|uniref:DUF4097 family beta strand repeat-containing protein n=1 Tax=unclassified Streptomyces TaxID=2593676 RepID=UPI0016617351|nr:MULTISPECIES: DUF4097 family beta strand repeat-containing protein [unclassified Streptomyces]MBD0709458.1 hypothetical protein [Streptomyces sp. CBMA291]MBD0713168.1 hypothetical protein [Streptomyces sp. CBMA370]
MPTFDTPEPLSATVEIGIGRIRVIAGERTDTVVDVAPSDPARKLDIQAAEETKVTCTGRELLVKGPRKRPPFGKYGLIDVTVHLPAGSDLTGTSGLGDLIAEGRFGDCRLTTATGHIHLEEAASVRLKTPHGDIMVDGVAGEADIQGSGRVRVGRIGGDATVKNLNGETVIGEITGELRVNSSNGPITVIRAESSVTAKTASGAIRVDEVVRGKITLDSSVGGLEVGIAEGTAAWLDVRSKMGRVRNELGPADGPGQSTETAEVRGRTSVGDIVIRRA